MRIGFIGAGKVGFSLGKFFAEGGITVTGYYSRHQESAQEAAEFTGTRCFNDISQLIEESDAIFLTVPDKEIVNVYEMIRSCHITDKQICHCSGAMTADEAFYDVAEHGASGYSIHPLFPISSKYDTYRELSDAFFCLEGDKSHIEEWRDLLLGLGVSVRSIEPENKVTYHAACAIASNLVCGLIQQSCHMLGRCGFAEEEALKALSPLVRSNIEHILQDGALMALTGPMERCDTLTVGKHMECMENAGEKELYVAVSHKLLDMAQLKHPETDFSGMKSILERME